MSEDLPFSGNGSLSSENNQNEYKNGKEQSGAIVSALTLEELDSVADHAGDDVNTAPSALNIKKSPDACVGTSGDSNDKHTGFCNKINLADLTLYLKTISRTNTAESIFTYSWLDSASKTALKGYGVRFGTYTDMCSDYSALESVGGLYANPTLHIVLNETKLTGRRNEDVECPRVLCLDLDTPRTSDEIKQLVSAYSPAMVIETSPGKYHIYWKIDYLVPLLKWSIYQLGLAALFNGDPELAIFNHTARAPGFIRLSKDGTQFLPRIVYRNPDAAPLFETEIEDLWPTIIEDGKKLDEARQTNRKKLHKKIKAGDVAAAAKLANSSGRNSTLFSYVFEVIKKSDDRLSVETAYELAEGMNEEFKKSGLGGLGEDEVRKTARSAWERGCEKQDTRLMHQKYQATELAAQLQQYGHIKGELFQYDYTAPLMESPFSEIAVAGRVLQKFYGCVLKVGGGLYAYNHDLFTWQPQRRIHDVLAWYINSCLKDLIKEEGFLKEYCTDKDGGVSLSLKGRAERQFLKTNVVRNALWQILEYKNFPSVSISDFDNAPYLLYCKNGVVNLETKELRSPTPEDMLLQKTDVSFDASAMCPDWCQFLSEVFADNDDPEGMVALMQRIFGYTLTGSINAQLLFIHYGESCNGKSKVLYALDKLMGSYVSKLACNTLAASEKAVQKEFERIGAKLEGKRVVIIDDLDTKTQWSEGYVKMLTGPSIVARKLYEEERDIPNRGKFHIACNTAPAPQGNNMAILRRMCMIPYNRQFKQDAVKEQWICDMIERELPGILNWAIEGLREYRNEGKFNFPGEIESTIQEYKETHFTADAAIIERVSTLCVKPSPEDDSAQNVYMVKEIAAHINKELKSEGIVVSTISLGRYLKGLGFESFRHYLAGVQRRCYKVKLISGTAAKF